MLLVYIRLYKLYLLDRKPHLERSHHLKGNQLRRKISLDHPEYPVYNSIGHDEQLHDSELSVRTHWNQTRKGLRTSRTRTDGLADSLSLVDSPLIIFIPKIRL